MKIYVDTNWFLSFYQSNHERQHVLEQVVAKADLLVLTEQNITEFRRNREKLLAQLREQIAKSTRALPYTTSLLVGLDEHKRVLECARALTEAGKALCERVEALGEADQVLQTFSAVLTKCQVIRVLDDDVVRAQRRKARGIPPSSPKRDTIGDELIWECLLRDCQEDLAIVSLDGDFLGQRELLSDEFAAHKSHRRVVYVGDKLSDALGKFGELTPEMYAAEYGRDPLSSCSNCGGNTWLYAGQDHKHEQELRFAALAGYEPNPDLVMEPEFEKAVYLCSQCRSIMLVT